MQALIAHDTSRYAKCIEVSKRIRWDIDRDVIRDRAFDFDHVFLPEGLSRVASVPFLTPRERLLLSHVQGRTYANMFGLVERFIGAKMLEISRDHWLGDQVALEAIVRFTDEELKHQALFRRIETLIARGMPAGYRFLPQPNDVADFVLGKCTWAVLALTCHIELFSQAHYRQIVEPEPSLSPLFKDILFFHWREESQHAIVDELEWKREHAKLDDGAKEAAVDDLIALVAGVDGILAMQAPADVDYFMAIAGRPFTSAEAETLRGAVLGAYRWQYIVSGVQEPRFAALLGEMTTAAQMARIGSALAPIMQ
jgi:hypothetical protein